jgi:large subunit ribosomal protein L6
MSRVGRMPIVVPSGVKVSVNNSCVHVEGPQGKLDQTVRPEIKVELKEGKIIVSRQGDSISERAFHGLFQRLISNMIIGVSKGFEKNLEIQGVGFRAKVEGKSLVLQIGFSHPVKHDIPDGIKITVTDNTKINIKGADKRLVGELAAEIRRYYPPEPYKGKGIRYVGEYVRRKAGKAVAGKGAGAGGGK